MRRPDVLHEPVSLPFPAIPRAPDLPPFPVMPATLKSLPSSLSLLVATLALSCSLSAQAVQASAPAAASDAPAPTLTLDAQVREAVRPDTMRVVMAVERSGKDLGALNRQTLTLTQEGLQAAKAAGAGLEPSAGALSTNVVYDEKGRPQGWKVRAEIVLQGTSFEKVSTTSGQLANRFELVSLEFILSPQKRREVQESLRTRLGSDFRTKANAMARALGYSRAEVQSVQLQENASPRVGLPMAVKSMAMVAGAPPLPTEAGETEVAVSLSGTVLLLK